MDCLIEFYKLFAPVVLLVLYNVGGISASCYNKYVIKRGLSCEDKQLILEMHNQLRQSVALGQVQGQPGASSMMLISWDQELANKAQQLADSCNYGHDSLSARSVQRFYVGQNIATTWSTWERDSVADFATQIKAWFNEVYAYRFNSGFSHETGHYSQMVWGDTYLIGCGFTYFYDGYRYQKIYVCNYGPGGNVAGKAPYYPGQPACDTHGMIGSSKYYGLCDSYRTFYPDYTCYKY
ncbi:venom allergen 5-like [Planococcus citri]|uniref:venom allergen 5-like n=1 Tax=Planococcus citri TaxID=170843 RepID=UPI0031F9D889